MNPNLILFLALTLSMLLNYLLLNELRRLSFSKRSQSVKYGRFSEQFFPFIKDYPYDSRRFRFLGSPIDGVQFNDDKIVFIEFKVGSSRLNSSERKIKELVDSKKVYFEEFRIK